MDENSRSCIDRTNAILRVIEEQFSEILPTIHGLGLLSGGTNDGGHEIYDDSGFLWHRDESFGVRGMPGPGYCIDISYYCVIGKTKGSLTSSKPLKNKQDSWLRGLDLNQRPSGSEPNERRPPADKQALVPGDSNTP